MIDICKRIYSALEDPKIYRTRGNTGLYPSQASVELKNGKLAGGCHRQVYYQWKDIKPTNKGETDFSLSAEYGTWLHEGLVKFLNNHVIATDLIVLSEEHSFFDKELLLSGRTDVFLMDKNSDEIFGVEAKSVGKFSGKMCLTQPKIEHILQALVYLDQYRSTSKQGHRSIDYWVLLYMARDEDWDFKARKHGSVFRYMWQFWVTIEDDHAVVHCQNGTRTSYPEITISGIKKRYKELRDHLCKDNLPERDYELQYSEEWITSLYKSGELRFKKDNEAVAKWLAKGAKPDKLNLKMGDHQCMFCPWSTLCWSEIPDAEVKNDRILFSLEELHRPDETEKSADIII